jgi:hypothetical protein
MNKPLPAQSRYRILRAALGSVSLSCFEKMVLPARLLLSQEEREATAFRRQCAARSTTPCSFQIGFIHYTIHLPKVRRTSF